MQVMIVDKVEKKVAQDGPGYMPAFRGQKIEDWEFPRGAGVKTALSLVWAFIQFLVRELRSYVQCSQRKKENER